MTPAQSAAITRLQQALERFNAAHIEIVAAAEQVTEAMQETRRVNDVPALTRV